MKTKKTAILFMLAGIAFCGSQLPGKVNAGKNTGKSALLNSAEQSPAENTAKATALKNLGNLPLFFIRNDGQIHEKVLFYEKGNGHTTFFTGDGIYLNLIRRQTPSEKMPQIESHTLKLSFINANKNPRILAGDIQEGRLNYFVGSDPEKWRTNIPTYGSIVYKEVYRDIDIKFYGNNGLLVYDVIVRPGGDPKCLKFLYKGTSGLNVNTLGELEIALDNGAITQKRPYLYQKINGKKVPVRGRFKVLAGTSYGFEVASYDKHRPLIIDPVIEYSHSFGGDSRDVGHAIAIDDDGNAYITGETYSTDFPNRTQDPATYYRDVFVTKINADGVRAYSTVFGGTGYDDNQIGAERGHGIAVDSAGNAHIAGVTHSNDFPATAHAFQGTNAAGYPTRDAFYTVISPSGGLAYSSYFGGSQYEAGNAIALDSDDNVFITGTTGSTNLPTTSPLQATLGGGSSDAFVTKINFDPTDITSTSIAFSTYLGGNGNDSGNGIALDNWGNAYITGETRSSNLPGASTSSIQPMFGGGADAYVVKLNSAGSNIEYSTYLGGYNPDYGHAIAVGMDGSAYVTGYIYGSGGATSFPTVNPIQDTHAGDGSNDESFVTKINPTGSFLVYSTYLGGNGQDRGAGIAVDNSGTAYVVGHTASSDFPIVSPIDGHGLPKATDAFIARINPSGTDFIYSTYFGGDGSDFYNSTGTDVAGGVAVDNNGNAYVTGGTTSVCFPGAPQPPDYNPRCVQRVPPTTIHGEYVGNWHAFYAKISDDTVVPPAYPEVSSTVPNNGALNVSIGTEITARFTKDMNGNTIDESTFLLSAGGTPVTGSVSYDPNTWTATFTPSGDLDNGVAYTARITTGAQDTYGLFMTDNYTWSFTTTSLPDTTGPELLTTDPGLDETDVPVDSIITLTFNESVIVNQDSIVVGDAVTGIRIEGTVGHPSPNVATFTPSGGLFPYGKSIHVAVSVTDLAGNDLIWSPLNSFWFYTVCDPLAPTVVSASPGADAVDVPVDTNITITFDKAMNRATFNSNNFPLYLVQDQGGYLPIEGTYRFEDGDRIAILVPNAPLENGADYYTGVVYVEDTEGHALCGSFAFYFTTVAGTVNDADGDCLPNANEPAPVCESDADCDDDGLPDGTCSPGEDLNNDGIVDAGETDPTNPDSDGDGIFDGTEMGMTAPLTDDTDLSAGFFVADADPSSTTDPTDADSDDDGILDGNEDKNRDGLIDPTEGETDPGNPDSDGDGIYDGTEIGLTEPQDPAATDQSAGVYVPDADPGTTTDPTDSDTDGDGVSDGDEDVNKDGAYDPGQGDTNPNSVEADLDGDKDVDGQDLTHLADDLQQLEMPAFVDNYGRTDCP